MGSSPVLRFIKCVLLSGSVALYINLDYVIRPVKENLLCHAAGVIRHISTCFFQTGQLRLLDNVSALPDIDYFRVAKASLNGFRVSLYTP